MMHKIDAKIRLMAINNLIKELNHSYLFLEQATLMENDLRERLKNKEYDAFKDPIKFAEKLTKDLQTISKDKHLRVRYSAQLLPLRKNQSELTPKEKKARDEFIRRINFGFEKIECMSGNIGYINLRGFFDAEAGAETVTAAMNFLSNTESLIFDLRQNFGGDPNMVALISSYLFGDEPIHLNDIYWRQKDKTEEFWTTPKLANKKFSNKDVYILTSSQTFSGAEEFCFNLKYLKRATIVGETTQGGAHPGSIIRLSDHFSAFVPQGHSIHPITKNNWQDTGVEPDIKVPQEQALNVAYLMALTKSLKQVKGKNFRETIKTLIEKTQKELDGIPLGT